MDTDGGVISRGCHCSNSGDHCFSKTQIAFYAKRLAASLKLFHLPFLFHIESVYRPTLIGYAILKINLKLHGQIMRH
jgi:hypothetical protein